MVATKPDLTALLAEAKGYAANRTSRATNQAHEYDWKVYESWADVMGVTALPASTDTILAFLADQAKTKKMATLLRYKSSISVIHKEKDFPSPFAVPAVEHMLEGMRRQLGMAQEGRRQMRDGMVMYRRDSLHEPVNDGELAFVTDDSSDRDHALVLSDGGRWWRIDDGTEIAFVKVPRVASAPMGPYR